MPSYVDLSCYWIGLTLNNNNRWQKFTVEFSNKYDSYMLSVTTLQLYIGAIMVFVYKSHNKWVDVM